MATIKTTHDPADLTKIRTHSDPELLPGLGGYGPGVTIRITEYGTTAHWQESGPTVVTAWLTPAQSRKLRKALKRAEKKATR